MQINQSDESAILVAFDGPAFVGDATDLSYDLNCLKCGSILIKKVHNRQILGLVIECTCGQQNKTQDRFPGEPISSRCVLINFGKYLISSSISVEERPVQTVGESAMAAYRREVGYRQNEDANEPMSLLDAGFLRERADQAVTLMGKETYKRKLSALRKSAQSRTPMNKVNRLVELIEYARETAVRLQKAGSDLPVSIDGDRISELISITAMFRRWEKHPALSDLRKTLADSDNVYHSMMQLIVASYLVDNNNGVSLVFENVEGKRIADIYVRPTFVEDLYVEVKTPVALHGPLNAPLSLRDADNLIEKYLSAVSTKRGQVDENDSAILAICGLHLSAKAIKHLRGLHGRS
jgi:hypothetical protein